MNDNITYDEINNIANATLNILDGTINTGKNTHKIASSSIGSLEEQNDKLLQITNNVNTINNDTTKSGTIIKKIIITDKIKRIIAFIINILLLAIIIGLLYLRISNF